jgi:ABC-2 type transport system ATP-binding protein
MNVVEATGLGKRYWTTWALRDCTLAVPPGRVAALVGPNGAGKTTLMHLAVGLTIPTEGRVTVLGGRPAGSPEALNRVAFVAQDVPLYRHLPVSDMMHLARNLNGRRWDQPRADKRLAALGIPPRRKVGKLSGGQQAQVALTIALARRPEFLVLDEPLAPLDPLARHEFLASVMETVAEDGTSVLFSSHVVAELERIADYLVVLAGGRVQVAGDVETLLTGHQILTGPTPRPRRPPGPRRPRRPPRPRRPRKSQRSPSSTWCTPSRDRPRLTCSSGGVPPPPSRRLAGRLTP